MKAECDSDQCDFAIDSDVGTGHFLLVLGILHVFGHMDH